MSVFIDGNTTLIVQGITGRDGSFHAKQMMEYGTKVVAGVTPGKGGQKFEGSVPIFNTVADAVRETGANTSVIYVPPVFAAVSRTASATVLKTGTVPSNFCPPRPGVTPATTFVPYSSICFVWNDPSRPVMPCTTRRVPWSMKMLTRRAPPSRAARRAAPPRPCRSAR